VLAASSTFFLLAAGAFFLGAGLSESELSAKVDFLAGCSFLAAFLAGAGSAFFVSGSAAGFSAAAAFFLLFLTGAGVGAAALETTSSFLISGA
jgi:hypothetical protein